jgi:hypothetical protein
MVGLDRHAVGCLPDRYGADLGKDLRKVAVVLRVKVLNEYKGQARICGQIREQKLAGFQASSRGADPHHRQ